MTDHIIISLARSGNWFKVTTQCADTCWNFTEASVHPSSCHLQRANLNQFLTIIHRSGNETEVNVLVYTTQAE